MLRTATLDDLAAIMQLETASFGDQAWPESSMRDELVQPLGRYVVAQEGDALVGYAGMRASGNDADVQTIAVRDDARGRGIGAALLAELEAEALSRGATHIFLEVRADNDPARTLYATRGYDVLGVRPGYYQPGSVDAIVMRKALA